MKKYLLLLPTLLLAPIVLGASQVSAADAVGMQKDTTSAVKFLEAAQPLVIVEVPDLHFGENNQIEAGTELTLPLVDSGQYVISESNEGTLQSGNTIQIRDSRSKGNAEGWKLRAQFEGDFENQNGNTFSGSISFTNASVTESSENNPSTLGTNSTINSEENVIAQRASGSSGLSTLDFTNDDVKLTVPAAAQLDADGIYQTTIKWTLISAPDTP